MLNRSGFSKRLLFGLAFTIIVRVLINILEFKTRISSVLGSRIKDFIFRRGAM